jgi:hypothetical protein
MREGERRKRKNDEAAEEEKMRRMKAAYELMEKQRLLEEVDKKAQEEAERLRIQRVKEHDKIQSEGLSAMVDTTEYSKRRRGLESKNCRRN